MIAPHKKKLKASHFSQDVKGGGVGPFYCKTFLVVLNGTEWGTAHMVIGHIWGQGGSYTVTHNT